MASPGLCETAQPSNRQQLPCGQGQDLSGAPLTGGGHSNSGQRPPLHQQHETWVEEKKAKGREKKLAIKSHPLLTPEGTTQKHGENHIKRQMTRVGGGQKPTALTWPDQVDIPKIPKATNCEQRCTREKLDTHPAKSRRERSRER